MGSFARATRRTIFAGAAIGVLALAAGAAEAAPDAPRQYNLKSEDLETALHEVAVLSGRSILAPSRLVAGRRGPALSGRYSAATAVQMLLAGSGLHVSQVGETLVVTDPVADSPVIGTPPVAAAPAPEAQGSDVVVTASHIKGAPPAAPIHTVTRTDIERAGYGEVGDLVRALPEAFGGGPNPGVLSGASAANAGNQNQTNGSSVNLRGLGSDATLVLLDGHRMAADGQLQAVDISVIPLAAIDHVEVITDGASAIYGSDAVAGVANFVMRSNYDGAEFDERIGGATESGDLTQSYTVLAGKAWEGGHALASIEYLDQDPILASQRAFTSGAPGFNSLIEGETQTSAFVNFGQDLAPWASFHLDGLYGQRSVGVIDQLAPGEPIYHVDISDQSYLVAPSLELALPDSWSGRLDGSISATREFTTYHFSGTSETNRINNNTNEIEASANGPVFDLPGGPVKLAVGGGYRDERFAEAEGFNLYGSRGVAYAFGEVFAPLISPSDDRFLLQTLDVSLAGRWERYSDFGTTANPKVGLRYKPVDGVILRATWGTSFKAPDFIQQTSPALLYNYPVASLGGTGSGTALLKYGGNPDLRPETSNSWTAGIDWQPLPLRPLKVSLTYFNIDFTNRIVQPITGLGTALANPIFAPFIIAHPTSAQQAAAVQSAFLFYNLTGQPYDPSNVTSLIDDLFANAASQKIDGVDLSIKDSFDLTPADSLDAFVDASWLHILQQSVPGGPEETLTGTLFNPPKLRIRSGVTWTHGPFSGTGIVNYISGETDNGVLPNAPISPWTTLDLNLTYAFGRLGPWLPDLRASLSMTNAFNAGPPFARGASVEAPGYNFDSTNASAIGRFIALTLRERL